MRNPPLGPELRELLEGGDEGLQQLREVLEGYHPNLAAEILTALEPEEITKAMGLLPLEIEQEMFSYFEPDLQEQIVLGSSRARIRELLTALPSDERAVFLDRLDEGVRQQLLPLLAREDRLDVLRRERFEDDQVGSIMSTEFSILGQELTMPRALEELRRQAPGKETIYYSYVLDREGKLKGFVSLRKLIVAPPRSTVGDVMKTEVVYCRTTTDQEEAARMIRDYDLLALPVVDSADHMVGIVTHDDAVDIFEEEVTEDVKMIAGITGAEEADDGYLQTSVWRHFRGRVSLLSVLALSFLAIAAIIDEFGEKVIHGASAPKLAVAFMPLLLATGANVGGQASALVLRALAMQTVSHSDIRKVLWLELRVSISLCVVLGSMVFGLAWVFSLLPGQETQGFDLDLAMGVAGAVSGHVVSAALLGASIPLIFARLDMRPEAFSHPVLNFVADTSGTIIYILVLLSVWDVSGG